MSPEQIAILRSEAERWRGTPFRARSRACGPRGGADCIQYVFALVRATDAVPDVEFPRYRIDSGSHLATSPLLEFLRGQAQHPDSVRVSAYLEERSKDDPVEPGDVIVFEEGRTAFHAGVVLTADGDFTHVLIGRGVTISSLRDSTYADRLQAVFRPVARKEAV